MSETIAEPPKSFYDFSGNRIVLWGEMRYNYYKCPRCSSKFTTEVGTTDGDYLYCGACQIFSPEFGMWGYKTEQSQI